MGYDRPDDERLAWELSELIRDIAAYLRREQARVRIRTRAVFALMVARRVARGDLADLSVKRPVSAYPDLPSTN